MKTCHRHDAPLPEGMSPEEHAARREVRVLRRFYQQLLVFALVGGGFAVLNLAVRPDRLWFPWVLGIWAAWLAVRAIRMAARGRWLGAAWEERQVRERLARR